MKRMPFLRRCGLIDKSQISWLPTGGCAFLLALIFSCTFAGASASASESIRYVAKGETPPTNEAWTPCGPATKGHPECELIVAPKPSNVPGLKYEGSGPEEGLTPTELREAYKLPTGGSGSTVAVVDGEGDPDAESDLNVYRKEFGMSECTEGNGCFKQVNEHGEAHKPTYVGGWVGEISLDLDMVSAACADCHIILVEAANEESGLLEAQEAAIKLGANAVSNSWNMGFESGNPANKVACEEGYFCVSETEEKDDDPYFDHPGTPILFAGGDYGYAVRYPAVSQYVIAVGGTELQKASNSRKWIDKVWSTPSYGVNKKGRGTGSGCSIYEPEPKWEEVPSNAACKKRMQNDIAADADWTTSPVAIYDSYEGGWSDNGGTSASSPFVAGVEGLSSKSVREHAAEDIWLAGEAKSLFDVTEGSNGTCTPPEEDAYWCMAETGYDGPTGWGTPDGAIEVGPNVTGVSPSAGPDSGGTSVTITGTSLEGATAVKFGATAATSYKVESATTITATSPSHADGTVDVTVTTPEGTSATSSADHYTFLPKPAVANVQPNAGASSGGTTVMITGSGFSDVSGVKFGTSSATSYTVISESWISAVSPSGSGTVDVTVTTPAGTSATGSSDHFIYRSGGTVLGWGDNSSGELGAGTTSGPETCSGSACSRIPVAASGSPIGVTQVSSGQDHGLALKSSGHVLSWGANYEGQLGNGTTTSSDSPVEVSSVSEATAVSAGNEFSLALLKGGTVDSWGANYEGQLGNGSTTYSDTPVKVSGISEATAVSAGETHALALMKNGTVKTWGENYYGELGNGTKTSSDTPVEVDGITEAVAVSAGGEFSLALLKNGKVMAWGANYEGELGDGTLTSSDVPVEVSGLTEVTGIAAGSGHGLALLKTGSVKSWGANQSGQLGYGSCCSVSETPVTVSEISEATAVAAGYHSLAMLRNGTVEDWGRNSQGQLGDGTSTGPEICDDEGSERSCSTTPVPVSGLTEAVSVDGGVNFAQAISTEVEPPRPTVSNVQADAGASSGGTTVMITGTGLTDATNVKFGSTSATSFKVISSTWVSAVSPSGSGTVDVTVTTPGGTSATGSSDHFIYRSGGTVLGWGDNGVGELGAGTTTGPETCDGEACSRIPVAASGTPSGVTQVSAGQDHGLALKSSGHVLSWGANYEGQLGNGSTTSSDSPVEVSSVSEATAVSAGNEFSLALLKSGTVDSWGYNGYGQLGNGTTTSSDSPMKVSGISEATAVSAGETHALALMKNGTVMAWGENSDGELGNGTTTSSDTPVKVNGISEAVAVAAGGEFSLALLKNGTVMAWGWNGDGGLGNGTTSSSDVPVKVSSLSEVRGIAAGSAHSLALLANGSVKSWGANQSGQLGDGSCCEISDVPVSVSSISEATSVAAGYHSLAMLRNGTVEDWGRNSQGQLGDGTSTGPEICDDEGSERSCSKTPVAVSGLTEAISVDGGVNFAQAIGAPPSYTQTIDSGHSLGAISCVPSTSDCVASDSQGKVFYTTDATATASATWTTWSGPGTSPSEAIDCPTTGLCLLAAGEDEGDGGNLYYATSLGGSWTEAYSPVWGVDAISCVSSSFCVDGQDGDGYFRYAISPASTSWNLEEQGEHTMTGVDCISTSFCAIVDSAGNVHIADTTTLIESSSWTSTNVDSTALHGIACTSTSSCVAVDGAGQVLNLTISGTSASVSKDDIDGSNDLTAVTCTGSTCVAVDSSGNVFVSPNDGSTWSKQYALGDDLTSVSCSSDSLCAATDTTGKVTTFNP